MIGEKDIISKVKKKDKLTMDIWLYEFFRPFFIL